MYGPQAANLVQVVGRRGHASSTDRSTLQVVTHGGIGPGRGNVSGLQRRTLEPGVEADGGTGAMLDHFAALIAGGAVAPEGATLHEGMVAVAVTEALEAAARAGRRVDLAAGLG
jgi:predicted dehydrogenase